MHADAADRPVERDELVEQDQPARQPRLLGILDQRLASLGLLDLAGPGQEGFEVAILGDELGRRLHPDAGHARHIVDRIADQGLHVDDLLGRHAELLDDLVGSDALFLHAVVHGHPMADELHQVLVGGDDGGGGAGLAGEARIGGDDVVGLVAVLLDTGDVEGLHGVADQLELRPQLLGRRGPVGLVGVVERVAEGGGGMVQHDSQMRRLLARDAVANQPPEHVAEAGHGADRQPVRLARQRRQRVVRPEDVGRAIDKEHMVAAPDRAVGGGGR